MIEIGNAPNMAKRVRFEKEMPPEDDGRLPTNVKVPLMAAGRLQTNMKKPHLKKEAITTAGTLREGTPAML